MYLCIQTKATQFHFIKLNTWTPWNNETDDSHVIQTHSRGRCRPAWKQRALWFSTEKQTEGAEIKTTMKRTMIGGRADQCGVWSWWRLPGEEPELMALPMIFLQLLSPLSDAEIVLSLHLPWLSNFWVALQICVVWDNRVIWAEKKENLVLRRLWVISSEIDWFSLKWKTKWKWKRGSLTPHTLSLLFLPSLSSRPSLICPWLFLSSPLVLVGGKVVTPLSWWKL